MENKQDPRFQIYADLDRVEQEIHDAAKERIKEIKKETKEETKAIKKQIDELKKDSKEKLDTYKDMMEERKDPSANEKISAAKDAHNVIEKDLDNEYENTKYLLERERDRRIDSIENMLDEDNR